MYSVAYRVARGHNDEISAPKTLESPSILNETVYLSTNLKSTTPVSGGFTISIHATAEVITVMPTAIISIVLLALIGEKINNAPAKIGKNMAKKIQLAFITYHLPQRIWAQFPPKR